MVKITEESNYIGKVVMRGGIRALGCEQYNIWTMCEINLAVSEQGCGQAIHRHLESEMTLRGRSRARAHIQPVCRMSVAIDSLGMVGLNTRRAAGGFC